MCGGGPMMFRKEVENSDNVGRRIDEHFQMGGGGLDSINLEEVRLR